MKKSRILVLFGALIIFTSLFINYDKENIYKKRIIYKSVDDIVQVLDTKVLNIWINYSDVKPIDDFQECLSKRIRTVGSGINFSYLDLKENEEKNTSEIKNEILKNYYHGLKNIGISDFPKVVDVRVYDCKGYYNYGDYTESESFTLDIVFIEEDEGIVIDYMLINSSNEDDFKSELFGE